MPPKQPLRLGVHHFKSERGTEDGSHGASSCVSHSSSATDDLRKQVMAFGSFHLPQKIKHVALLARVVARLVFRGMCFCSTV